MAVITTGKELAHNAQTGVNKLYSSILQKSNPQIGGFLELWGLLHYSPRGNGKGSKGDDKPAALIVNSAWFKGLAGRPGAAAERCSEDQINSSKQRPA